MSLAGAVSAALERCGCGTGAENELCDRCDDLVAALERYEEGVSALAPAPSPRSPEAARCPLHGAPDCGGASGGYECGCAYGKPMPIAAPSPDDGALEALREVNAALRDVVEAQGIEHDDEDCPEDDTCRCALVERVNGALSKAAAALARAKRS